MVQIRQDPEANIFYFLIRPGGYIPLASPFSLPNPKSLNPKFQAQGRITRKPMMLRRKYGLLLRRNAARKKYSKGLYQAPPS